MEGFGTSHSGKKQRKNFPQRIPRVNGDALFKRAIDFHLQGDILNAEKCYRGAIACGVLHSGLFSNLGVLCQATQRMDEAIANYTKAIEINPSNSDPYTNLGGLYQNLGRLDQALAPTLKSLELNPDNPTTLMNLGAIYKDLGRFDQALAPTLKSLELNPDNSIALMNLGSIYQDLGNLDRALASTLKSLELNPENSTALINLGSIYQDLGNFDRALASTLKSLELSPDNPTIHMKLGWINKNLGNLDQALASTLKSLDLQPDNPTAYMNLGAIHLDLHEYHKALNAALEATKLQPNNSDNYVNLCEIYKRIDNMPKAIESINHAISLDTKNAQAYLVGGVVCLEVGNALEAENLLLKSIEINDKLNDSHKYLSIALFLKGNHRASIESIELAMKINPSCRINKEVEFMLKNIVREDKIPTSLISDSRLNQIGETTFPITLERKVEKGLIDSLRRIEYLDLEKRNLPTKGNAKTSDFLFFKKNPHLQSVEHDLISLATEATGTTIYIQDSWFTILSGGGIVRKHNHASELSKIKSFGDQVKSFALVYYVDVGDQCCDEPGFLRFYDPDEQILPTNGMIVIFPADRYHSVRYSGTKERVIIGLNFLSV